MVKILADSTCDLSPALISKYKIGIIPLYVHLGEKEYKDGVNITPAEIYKWSDEHKETPRTSAPGIDDIEAFLDKDSTDEYVIFTISSSMSSCYNDCILAVDDLGMTDRVRVIDSANLSTGIGLQVIKAAELAGSGCGQTTPEVVLSLIDHFSPVRRQTTPEVVCRRKSEFSSSSRRGSRQPS